MDTINRLIQIFSEFPGIGPRQARRFVYFLLTRPAGYLDEMARLVPELKRSIRVCQKCHRFFPLDSKESGLCLICRDKNRDASELMIVARDVDLDTVEKSHSYNGLYFVLGGTVPILDKAPEQRVRSRELAESIPQRLAEGLKEVILSLNANPEGENTEGFIRAVLAPFNEKHGLKISVLGRGLSTGSELEYADSDTIRNALDNRK